MGADVEDLGEETDRRAVVDRMHGVVLVGKAAGHEQGGVEEVRLDLLAVPREASAGPCGDLWNLVPCHDRTNRREQRERLPSATAMALARERIMERWTEAYLEDPGLRSRFALQAAAALPLAEDLSAASVFAAVDRRRLRLRSDRRMPEWTPRRANPTAR